MINNMQMTHFDEFNQKLSKIIIVQENDVPNMSIERMYKVKI